MVSIRKEWIKNIMNLIDIFKETLEISKKILKKIPASKYYKENNMKIIFSEDTVSTIFAEDGRIAALIAYVW